MWPAGAAKSKKSNSLFIIEQEVIIAVHILRVRGAEATDTGQLLGVGEVVGVRVASRTIIAAAAVGIEGIVDLPLVLQGVPVGVIAVRVGGLVEIQGAVDLEAVPDSDLREEVEERVRILEEQVTDEPDLSPEAVAAASATSRPVAASPGFIESTSSLSTSASVETAASPPSRQSTAPVSTST